MFIGSSPLAGSSEAERFAVWSSLFAWHDQAQDTHAGMRCHTSCNIIVKLHTYIHAIFMFSYNLSKFISSMLRQGVRAQDEIDPARMTKAHIYTYTINPSFHVDR